MAARKTRYFVQPGPILKTKQSIYLITDGYRLRKAGTLVSIIEKVLAVSEGFVKYLQLREQKENPASDPELKQVIQELLPICKNYQVKLVLNSNYQLALETSCAGVHLTGKQNNFPEIRKLVGNDFIIGYSAHSVEEVSQAEKAACDYVLLSPIYQAISKTMDGSPLGLEYLKKTQQSCKIPIYALGGIDLNNCKEVLKTGVSGVGMISSVLLADNPAKAMEKFVKLFRTL